VLAGAGEQLLGLVELNPADRGGLVGMAVGGIVDLLFAGPARLDDVPAISRRLSLVNDDRGGGALPGRFLELVGPASVIGHRATVEFAFGFSDFPVRIVDEDDDRLPLYIKPGIVVPALFGGVDAIADEHDRAVLDL